jgi:formylglycine-generating enzyme required for sulfatase activity
MKTLALLLTLALAQSSIAHSEISFEWVTVGDPGNPNDPLTAVTTGGQTPPVRGAVPYVYSISKYETTIGQYTAFLNAVAKSNPERAFSLWTPDLQGDRIRGIARVTKGGKDVYHVKTLSFNLGDRTSAYLPITCVSYLDAVRFANWLHNGQGEGSTETGAYTISEGQITRASRSGGVVTLITAEPHSLNVGDWVQLSSIDGSFYYGSAIVTARTDTTFSYFSGVGDDLPEQELPGSMIGVSARKSDARYWVPSENEWYKAAYYDPSPEGPADDYWRYPWRSDSTASGHGNYYVVRYMATLRPELELYYTYVMDVRAFGAASYYGTVSQAGNVEEWTEGDLFSGGPHTRGGWWQKSSESVPQTYAFQRIASFYAPPPGVAPPEEPSFEGLGIRIATVATPPPQAG